ncbi:DNA repair protein RadA [Brevibacillus dissolubilis]|uniref:DNA repair protein RadA n=1 Tax=Brevibacillus dissolubilis TaxID=1844116 RepID=UPI001116513C|nr:DNA repair protein RadA [Brevibacillus dissolubilis]
MTKSKTKFACQECGYESPKWMGKCPGCHNWNTMVEETITKAPAGGRDRGMPVKQKALPLTDIDSQEEARLDTTIGELNRVLGGGLVLGSLVLVGGDPGIGKSTLLLQTCFTLAHQGHKVLYISGEESVKQIKMRADRLGVQTPNLLVVTETDLEVIEEQINQVDPFVMVVDSIQTVFHPAITSAAGSVAQVRETTAHLLRIAKSKNIATFIVGHVTKEGAIAGPRMLEHMVDAVLYFEGERHHTFRILRAVKNRFGSTNEIGIFEMKEKGLEEVVNPSEIFLAERPVGVAGSTVVASIEGTRPVLVELQALVSPTSFVTPRRMATGVDHQRVAMITAVLEKRVGLMLQSQDAYVNVAGGVRLDEPAIDLAIAVSIVSSFRDHPANPHDVVFGEIGLTGEVRGVSRVEQRIREAAKLGFKRVIMPEKSMRGIEKPADIELIGVKNIEEALDAVLRG